MDGAHHCVSNFAGIEIDSDFATGPEVSVWLLLARHVPIYFFSGPGLRVPFNSRAFSTSAALHSLQKAALQIPPYGATAEEATTTAGKFTAWPSKYWRMLS